MASKQAAKVFGIVEVLAKIPDGPLLPVEQIAPFEIVLELPAPPSINRAGAEWRLGNKALRVQRWRRKADGHLLITGQHRKLSKDGNPLIEGFFGCDVLWDHRLADELHSDIDNRVKYLLDYLQYLRIIENDRNCRPLHVDYGDAPDGCCVRLLARGWQT